MSPLVPPLLGLAAATLLLPPLPLLLLLRMVHTLLMGPIRLPLLPLVHGVNRALLGSPPAAGPGVGNAEQDWQGLEACR